MVQVGWVSRCRSSRLSLSSLLFLCGSTMLLLVCMAMYGLEIDTELATPDHEDLHGVAPKQTSFSGLDFVGNGLNVNDELAPFEQKMPGKLQSADGQARQRAVPPQVRIDAHGVFKYVLLELEGADDTSVLVRGTARFNFHKQNVQEAQKELGVLGLPPSNFAYCHRPRVLGGGRLRVHPPVSGSVNGRIEVFGYSKTYGRCESCNRRAAELLRLTYPDYDIVWSNEGY